MDKMIEEYKNGLISAIEFRDKFILFLMECNEHDLSQIFDMFIAEETGTH